MSTSLVPCDHHAEYYIKGGDLFLMVSLTIISTKTTAELFFRPNTRFSACIRIFSLGTPHDSVRLSANRRLQDGHAKALLMGQRSNSKTSQSRSLQHFSGFCIIRKPVVSLMSQELTGYSLIEENTQIIRIQSKTGLGSSSFRIAMILQKQRIWLSMSWRRKADLPWLRESPFTRNTVSIPNISHHYLATSALESST